MTAPAATSDETRRLQERVRVLEGERRHLLTIIEVLREIIGATHYVDIVQVVARRLGSTFGLDRCSIFLAERGGGSVHLVASYEDPAIRNHVVDLARYPELKRALDTGRTVSIPDALLDPSLAAVVETLNGRQVQSITVVPITWRSVAIGAIFLRTYRGGKPFADEDLEFCRVIAELTGKALRLAYRFERLQTRHGGLHHLAAERERTALLGFLRRLMFAWGEQESDLPESALARASTAELDRLVQVALTVISAEAHGR